MVLKVLNNLNYDVAKWLKRNRLRTDISGFITHLTKEQGEIEAVDILLKILRERKINGSTTDKGFIIGTNRAVCFQDAPLQGLTQNLIHEQYNQKYLGGKSRYVCVGLAFSKKYAYEKGARPVLYETKEIAKNILPETEWWRIVSFDLTDDQNIIDWTHEREWRVKGDFEFKLNEVFVYLVKDETYKKFLEKAGIELVKEIRGIVVLDPVLT